MTLVAGRVQLNHKIRIEKRRSGRSRSLLHAFNSTLTPLEAQQFLAKLPKTNYRGTIFAGLRGSTLASKKPAGHTAQDCCVQPAPMETKTGTLSRCGGFRAFSRKKEPAASRV